MENWKQVFETKYLVSDKGTVMNFQTGKIIKNWKNKQNYLKVSLYHKGKSKKHSIHRLVGLHFISNPENKPQINHKNGDKHDNRVSNLEWNTSTENNRHAHKNGFYDKDIENKSIPVVGTNIKTGEKLYFKSSQEAGRNGFTQSSVISVINGKWNIHKGYVWKRA